MTKRSYFEEIKEIISTWDAVQAFPLRLNNFDPAKFIGDTFSIGSGGSLCLAKYWQNICENQGVGIAKTLTPYEFYNTKSTAHTVALFSASGKNHDILQVFRLAISRGSKVLVFTTSKKSALVNLTKSFPGQAYAIYPSNNTPKDGFLAVNSTVAMSCLIVQFVQYLWGENCCDRLNPVKIALNDHLKEKKDIKAANNTFQIITSEWGTPAGYDFEARLAESGLGPCFLTDPRNFGHGRFLWLEKWRNTTSIIIFATKSSKAFINRFLNTLPNDIPIYAIISPLEGLYGATYCIVRSILLFGDLAKKSGIDPGKPEVPEWGKKLHRLRYNFKPNNEHQFVKFPSHKKGNYPAITSLFSSIALDFDGTIIDTKDRFCDLREDIISELERVLSQDIIIGIATGRGGSAYKLLRKQISKKYYHKIILGLYNGTLLFSLNDKMPIPSNNWSLQEQIDGLVKECINEHEKISSRPTQISIRDINIEQKKELINHLENKLGQHSSYVRMQISGHSIDILPHWATKISVVQALNKICRHNTLCIGDQGQLGGNDEELLNWNPSISVGELRPASNNCLWLGRNKDFVESAGTYLILKNIQKDGTYFKFKYTLNDH